MKAIMVMFDSLNRKYLEPYGCKGIKTPNFNRLAEKAVTFDCNYVGSMPCMPARRELHTGRYNFLHRSWGPMEPFDNSMPEILKSNGVYTHLVSDHAHYWEDGGCTYHTRYNSWETSRGQEGDPWIVTPELIRAFQQEPHMQESARLHIHDQANRSYIDELEKMPQAVTFTRGLEFLERNVDADNWFLQIETFDPHEPFFIPENVKNELDAEVLDLSDWPLNYFVTETGEEIDYIKNSYAALITMCDRYLGKVLDFMDQHNMWEDTLLVVNTDHGYLLGEHGWWGKAVMPIYEEIARTPLFIHFPQVKAKNDRSAKLTQTIDIPATILDFFSIEKPKEMMGESLRRTIEQDEPVHEHILFGYHESHVNITDGRYVYMRSPKNHLDEMLYDYTLMPTHMRCMFSPAELQTISLAPPFDFTKGCQTMRIKARPGKTNPANYGTRLYDLSEDPFQEAPLTDYTIETELMQNMIALMKKNDAPTESYVRFNLPRNEAVTVDEVRKSHEGDVIDTIPIRLRHLSWDTPAKNMYYCLLRFIEEDDLTSLVEAIQKHAETDSVDSNVIRNVIQDVIPPESQEMVRYFTVLNGRHY